MVLTGADGASAEIHLHGAHVTSWKPAGKGEQLFLSTKSEFGGNAAIRGGVPVIFPQFSLLGPLPRHGFVRNSAWELLRQTPEEVTMYFMDTPETRAIWPHSFRLEFTVRLEPNRLEMRLHVINTGATSFAFASALHTYLRVDDIANTTVEGLKDLTYRDANTMAEHVDKAQRIDFEREVDRLYYGAEPRTITVNDGTHSLTINTGGFPDAVVWNPNKVKSDNMADMEANGWQRFVCVEAAAASDQIRLDPTEKWTGQQTISLNDPSTSIAPNP
ncbi:MAG: Aldose 1-epimerase [Verrucomicrobiaceae bacterium]|nr:Aldose 1-epimerase [Verrucomicrobiaceae bacterium]